MSTSWLVYVLVHQHYGLDKLWLVYVLRLWQKLDIGVAQTFLSEFRRSKSRFGFRQSREARNIAVVPNRLRWKCMLVEKPCARQMSTSAGERGNNITLQPPLFPVIANPKFPAMAGDEGVAISPHVSPPIPKKPSTVTPPDTNPFRGRQTSSSAPGQSLKILDKIIYKL